MTREVIDACTIPGRFELPRITGVRYHAYVDPSGSSANSMTLAIAHLDKRIAVLDLVREVRPPFSPEAVTADFCAILKGYGIGRVSGDRYAGEWPREQFRKGGIGYDVSDMAASDLYRDLLPRLNSQQVELLDLPRIAKQFGDLERRTSRGGRDLISHPPGGHDDLANAIAGSLLRAATVRPPLKIDPALLARI